MNKRLRTFLLVAVLLIVAVSLSGCAVQQGPVDFNAPPNLWDQIVVYPLAKVLMYLNGVLASIGVRYSYGWAIIILTIVIKLVTLPLTLKQLQSTKATQALQPKLKELQEKYGKDRQKLSEEQMKLYKEAGVNPMGGCLPLLIQLPILWGLYQSLYVLARLPEGVGLRGASFFWIPDLAFPNQVTGTKWISASFQAKDWATLFAYMSLPVIMLVTQLLLQKMSQPPKDPKGGSDSQAQMMGQMMMFMPIMFGYITLGLPSGLTLYWTTSNILSLVQQYFVTGWGSLGDWVPMLRPKPVQEPVAAMALPSVSSTSSELDKPVKRRRRRK